MCFWYDLRFTYNTSQGVYYAVNGVRPNRQVTLEYLAGVYDTPSAYYHFQIIFLENQPNMVKCKYLDLSDGGESATIGVQCKLFKFVSFMKRQIILFSRLTIGTLNSLFIRW